MTAAADPATLAIDAVVIKEGFNAREIDEAGLAPLVESIKEVGVLVPLLVSREPVNGNGTHQLLAGEEAVDEERRDEYVMMVDRDNAAHLAARGLRFVFEDWQTIEKTASGKVKVHYLEVAEAEKRLWDWLGQASTAGEVFGRGLIIYAAAREALDVVLARSNRVQKSASTGNKDADAALAKILKQAALPTPALTKLAGSMKRWSATDQAKKQAEREAKTKPEPAAA